MIAFCFRGLLSACLPLFLRFCLDEPKITKYGHVVNFSTSVLWNTGLQLWQGFPLSCIKCTWSFLQPFTEPKDNHPNYKKRIRTPLYQITADLFYIALIMVNRNYVYLNGFAISEASWATIYVTTCPMDFTNFALVLQPQSYFSLLSSSIYALHCYIPAKFRMSHFIYN